MSDTSIDQSTDILIIYDLEKMRQKEQTAFVKQSMNYSPKIVSLGIGQPLIDVSFNHHIPSRLNGILSQETGITLLRI